MKNLKKIVVAGGLLCTVAASVWGQNLEKTEYGIQANVCDMVVDIRFYSPQIVRVLKYPKGGAIARLPKKAIRLSRSRKVCLTNCRKARSG